MAEPHEMYQCQTATCGYIYNPIRETAKAKSPKEHRLTIFPMTGSAPSAAPGKRCSNPWDNRRQFRLDTTRLPW